MKIWKQRKKGEGEGYVLGMAGLIARMEWATRRRPDTKRKARH
jgi:hypothetical protein